MGMASGGWSEDDDSALSEINITPLVDVAMVLLIIFMITAPMMVQGVDVRLPETKPMDRLPPNAVFLTITADEEVLLNDVIVSMENLEERLVPFASVPDQAAYVRADESVPHGTVVKVMEAAYLAGLTNIAMITRPLSERD
jgi:biopolymer transport protein TolR